MLPQINRGGGGAYSLPMFPSQLFIISSLTSATLLYSRYVLSQLHSLLTRSCVIKYNTYNFFNAGCIWLSDAGRCRMSNWFVRLISLQARESASSRPINNIEVTVLVEFAHYYSLLLLTAIMHIIHTFTEEALRNVPHDTQKHMRFVIMP